VSRRGALKTGAIAGIGLWAAPSILTLDRVEAAVGSCGLKPAQVTFSTWAGAPVPSTFTALDGTVVTMSQSDPSGVQDANWSMRSYGGTINGLPNPAITKMSEATRGVGVTVTFTFSIPVQPNFFLVDIDSSGGGNHGDKKKDHGDKKEGWEDTVQVTGSLGGTAVNPATMATGADSVQISTNTVRGISPSDTTAGNVEVDFQSPIDTLTVFHYDVTRRTGSQWIGIHDFHWC